MNKLDKWKQANSSFDFNEQLIVRQMKRSKQKVFFKRVLQTCTCVFALIFVLTNTSPTYIQATKDIPLLNKLNELFSLNKNMLVAIENDYIQELDIVKEEYGIKVDVDYMVMDEKSIYIFYTVTKDGERLRYTPDEYQSKIEIPVEDGSFSSSLDETEEYDIINYEILTLVDDVATFDNFDFVIIYNNQDIVMNIPVDQSKIAKKQVYEVNDVIDIEGQELIIEKVEVYPLSTRIYTKQNPNNTHEIKWIKFEMEINGKVRDADNGVRAVGPTDAVDHEMVYYIPSTYFLGNNFKIKIASAELIQKPGKVYYDLETNTFEDPTNTISAMRVYTKENHPSIYDNSFNYYQYVVEVEVSDEMYIKDRDPFTWTWLGSQTSYKQNKDGNEIFQYEISTMHDSYIHDNKIEFNLDLGKKVEVNKQVKLK